MSPAAGRCPGCGKSADAAPSNPWRPFCSNRCKMSDLGHWFAGRYAIPDEDEPLPSDEQRPQ